MRFVLTIVAITLLGPLKVLSAWAAPWDPVPLNNAQTQRARTVQMQLGGSANKLETIKELKLTIAVRGLGYISALAHMEDGTLITADAKSGRLWSLSDRGKDGKVDMRRPLPYHFQRPTGLAVIGNLIFVADRRAVWVIEDNKPLRMLASLEKAEASNNPLILAPHSDGLSLTLGLTKDRGGHQIIKINTQTGQAALVGEGQGPLHAISQYSGSNIWTAAGTNFGALGSASLDFATGQYVNSLLLPGQNEAPQNWPAKLGGHIIAAQSGPGAMRLIAIPTEFGQVSGAPRILLDGFLNRSGRSAWGKPGAMVMDGRGLFFADPENGTLWRLSPKPAAQPKITIVDTESLPQAPNAQPSLASNKALKIESSIKGVQIDASSTIIKPSSIEYGSKLIKDYDDNKAQEDAEKAKNHPKKKRRLSRKRKQPGD